MEITYIVFLIALVRGIVGALGKRRSAITTLADTAPESLCISCAYAHIARGYRERDSLIACTFGGTPRPLKFAVSTCTFYFNRAAIPQSVRVIGFADNIDQSASPAVAAKTGTE